MTDDARHPLEPLLSRFRPSLHRYCARMTGSAVDGEDVVQDTMMKALAATPDPAALENPGAWLFRIAHNTALDFLRHRARGRVARDQKVLDMATTPNPSDQNPEIASASLRTFMRLPALQRSTVILKDVLGHSLEEIASMTGTSEATAKSALQRGRARLRTFAAEPDDVSLPLLPDAQRARLAAYVAGFKAGDFDAVRAMLAEDVSLDLVAKLQRRGKGQVGEYLGRYAACEQWAFAAGLVDGRPAMLVFDRAVSLETPAYFVTLEIEGDRIVSIHDFLFARYAMEGITVFQLDRRTAG
jgi:RNA polymerase sigma-70 factor (ECF subfamily)